MMIDLFSTLLEELQQHLNMKEVSYEQKIKALSLLVMIYSYGNFNRNNGPEEVIKADAELKGLKSAQELVIGHNYMDDIVKLLSTEVYLVEYEDWHDDPQGLCNDMDPDVLRLDLKEVSESSVLPPPFKNKAIYLLTDRDFDLVDDEKKSEIIDFVIKDIHTFPTDRINAIMKKVWKFYGDYQVTDFDEDPSFTRFQAIQLLDIAISEEKPFKEKSSAILTKATFLCTESLKNGVAPSPFDYNILEKEAKSNISDSSLLLNLGLIEMYKPNPDLQKAFDYFIEIATKGGRVTDINEATFQLAKMQVKYKTNFISNLQALQYLRNSPFLNQDRQKEIENLINQLAYGTFLV